LGPFLDQFGRLGPELERLPENIDLVVDLAEEEVIDGDIRLQREEDVAVGGGGGQEFVAGRFKATADFTPEIDFRSSDRAES
jgi:hypothetical protein